MITHSLNTMAFTTNLWYDLGEYLISGTIAQVETVQH
jgi:hypothetical protein